MNLRGSEIMHKSIVSSKSFYIYAIEIANQKK